MLRAETMTTLSEEYRSTLKEMHRRGGKKGWGRTSSTTFLKTILELVDEKQEKVILDYGAGAGNLRKTLAEIRPDLKVIDFDPGRDDACAPAEPCDFVVCNDVFEHVEPAYLEAFFEDLVRVTNKWAYFTVCMTPAIKTLPDGRNAHLIVEPFSWWIQQVAPRFDIRYAIHRDRFIPQAEFIVEKKGKLPPYHVRD